MSQFGTLDPTQDKSVQPRSASSGGPAEIRIKGKTVHVPCARVESRTVISTGGWLKIATVQDDDLVEGEVVAEPAVFVNSLKAAKFKADIFTFAQKLPDTEPRHQYHVEWDNLAVIPITTFSDWWEKQAESSVRRAVRKAAKEGVVVKVAELDDDFVRGVVAINNETPIRQGKPFWHFEKSFEAVKSENSTYADRNIFLGAYLGDELVGFIRLTCVDGVAHILQLLSMVKHFDKRPANAMIAKAVEVCEQRKLSHLTYRNYVYNDPNSSLTEFKRRNGFEKVLLPRYYIPLTLRGRCALAAGLHLGLVQRLPKFVVTRLLRLRGRWYARKFRDADDKS